MKGFVSFSLFILWGFSILSAQNSLQKAIDQFAADPIFKQAQISVSVVEVESGRLLAGKDAHKILLPASSLKVVTTATALQVLGDDFRFKTNLEYDGAIDEDGTLQGNLYIKGYGDPTLGSDQYGDTPDLKALMDLFVAAVQKKGIRTINGQIVGDGTYFETASTGRTWPWEDLGNYYGAGIWGLNIHENLYHLHFRQNARLGAEPKIEGMEPLIPNLLLLNEVTSAEKGSGDNAYIFGSPYSYTRFIRGTIPIGKEVFSIKGSIPDPPYFAAHCLLMALEEKGISTNKQATSQLERNRAGEANSPRLSFYTHESPLLKDIVMEANQMSINLYCESLLKVIGMAEKKEASVAAGIEATKDYWKTKGMDMEGFFMEDGSGLSVRNAVSSYHLVSVLRLMAKEQKSSNSFYESLPLAAKNGTIKRMFKGSIAAGKLRAKSGGMERVRSYTGYTRNAKGQELAFSIIANNFSAKSSLVRQRMERLMIDFCR